MIVMLQLSSGYTIRKNHLPVMKTKTGTVTGSTVYSKVVCFCFSDRKHTKKTQLPAIYYGNVEDLGTGRQTCQSC